jgi:steroid 5-alpha reductase family enzyme
VHAVLWTALAVTLATWLLAVVTRDASWVDRIWSVVPVAYAWIFTGTGGWDARAVLVSVLITCWGARLTFNFARKGGYSGTEDYRWPVLRRRMKPWQWQVFLPLFVSGFQNALLVAITLPVWSMGRVPEGTVVGWTSYAPLEETTYALHLTPADLRPVGGWDVLLLALFVVFLVGETAADQQQWAFHRRKHDAAARGESLEPGFLDTGLFRYSRHPNFFCEQAQWWVVWLFAVVARGQDWGWTVLGAVALTGLFVGSTRFTESLSSAKYPAYADYRRRTSMLVPWWPRRVAGA